MASTPPDRTSRMPNHDPGTPLPYERGLHAMPERRRSIAAVLLGLLALGLVLGAALPLDALVEVVQGHPVTGLTGFRLTPGTWILGAALVAALIPLSAVVQRLVYGIPAGRLASVEGRFRWRWSLRAAVVIVPVFAVLAVLSGAVDPATWRLSLLPIALLAAVVTPLQAAGEEWLFRGLLSRAMAAPAARAWSAIAISLPGTALLFWLGHGATAPSAIAYYLAAGVGLWATAHWTGGLEAGCVMHACANTFLIVPAILSDRLGDAAEPAATTLLAPGIVWLLMPLVLRILARRAGIATCPDATTGSVTSQRAAHAAATDAAPPAVAL